MDGVSICSYRSASKRIHSHNYGVIISYNERHIFSSSTLIRNVNSFVGNNYYCESAFVADLTAWRVSQLYMLVTHFGMVINEKLPAVLVPHGSVCSFLLAQVILLKHAFAVMKVLIMKILQLLVYWRYIMYNNYD
jgi:hypothetical protein